MDMTNVLYILLYKVKNLICKHNKHNKQKGGAWAIF